MFLRRSPLLGFPVFICQRLRSFRKFVRKVRPQAAACSDPACIPQWLLVDRKPFPIECNLMCGCLKNCRGVS